MRITPKVALTTTAILVAVGLLWVGFLEGGRGQTFGSQGGQVSGVAGQYPNQLFAAGAMTASALPGFQQTGVSRSDPKAQDNLLALALSSSVIVSLGIVALIFARSQKVSPTMNPGMAALRRTRLAAGGTPQL